MTGRWGKAGVRRDPAEAAARRSRILAARNAAELHAAAAEKKAYAMWKAGKVVPWRITIALDANDLYGPEVDEACGAAEPDVDQWEAGVLYPTWNQLLALSELTGCTPEFFMWSHMEEIYTAADTTVRFHVNGADYRQPPPIRCFTPLALAAIREQP
jgi:hypothetical protein